MKLCEQSARLIYLLKDNVQHFFTNEELRSMLGIPTPRISDILSVLAAIYVVQKEGHRYGITSVEFNDALQLCVSTYHTSLATNSLAYHAKTVCYYLAAGLKMQYNRRTSDVLNILRGAGFVTKFQLQCKLLVSIQDLHPVELSTATNTPIDLPAFEILSFSDFDD